MVSPPWRHWRLGHVCVRRDRTQECWLVWGALWRNAAGHGSQKDSHAELQAKPSTSSPVERRQGRTVYHRTSLSAASLPSSSRFTSSSVNAGLKDTAHKTWEMQAKSPFTKTRVTEAIVIPGFRGISLLSVVDTKSPTESRLASLLRVPVRLQSRQVHSGHNLIPPTASREVLWAAAAIVTRFRGPDESLWPGQSKRVLPDP